MPRGRAGASCLPAAIACCLALGACGGAHGHHHTAVRARPGPPKPQILDIYSSLPLVGPAAAEGVALSDGMRLALSESNGRAGQFVIRYRPLDDARRRHGAWDASATAANARRAVTDPSTVFYLGDADSAATQVSLPLLNAAGIPQLSPASTYVGLTERVPGVSGPNEPSRFYPSGLRTFARVIPNDAVQAAAGLMALHEAGCSRLAIARTGAPGGYGAGLAQLISLQRSDYGMTIVSDAGVSAKATNLRLYAATLRARGAGCVAIMGSDHASAVALADAVHVVLPAAKILAPDRLCDRAWTDFRAGGVEPVVDPVLICTAPYAAFSAYPGGSRFLAGWRGLYGAALPPGPYAIYGYVAMRIALDTIAQLGRSGDDRDALIRAIFSGRVRDTVLGQLAFDREGDTDLRSYGLYRVGADGEPQFARLLVPPRVYAGAPS